jgi:uncharacterized protein (TIGR03435 family)
MSTRCRFRLAVFLLPLALVHAQESAFDAVSVKPAKPGTRGSGIVPTPAGVRMQNVTVKQMIAEAYHVYDMQIAGGPKWIDADRYDVEAKAPGGLRPVNEQRRAMMRKMLADRFGLSVHEKEQEMQAYLLEAGKNGPKLAVTKDALVPTVFRVYQRRQITAVNAPLDHLTEALTWMIGRPVLDRTGLDGTFDYKLEWSPDELQMRSTDAPVSTDTDAPSLEAALGELGLKLVSRKGPVKVIVVDKAERPEPN